VNIAFSVHGCAIAAWNRMVSLQQCNALALIDPIARTSSQKRLCESASGPTPRPSAHNAAPVRQHATDTCKTTCHTSSIRAQRCTHAHTCAPAPTRTRNSSRTRLALWIRHCGIDGSASDVRLHCVALLLLTQDSGGRNVGSDAVAHSCGIAR
jgi:hypothetical protein